MARTIEELKAALAENFDPDNLCELLNLSSEHIVEGFEDIIIHDYERLNEVLNEWLDTDQFGADVSELDVFDAFDVNDD